MVYCHLALILKTVLFSYGCNLIRWGEAAEGARPNNTEEEGTTQNYREEIRW